MSVVSSAVSSVVSETSKASTIVSSLGASSFGISNNNSSSEKYVATEDVQNAEIIWAMRLIEKHRPYRSCDAIQQTFTAMFPDSAIAKKMSIARTKAKYLINHGLAPYFAEERTTEIKEPGKIVACFDEALNNVAQRGQMDISIRFWDVNNSRVSTRYFSSVFLNHARALCQKLCKYQ